MEIRNIERVDIEDVVGLMRDFADYENLSEYCEITPQKLSGAIFGAGAFVEGVVALHSGKLIGYALFYPHFASFRGESGFYLEDIFVSAEFRGKGVGEAMLRNIAGLAAARGFVRLDFQVLDWNEPAVDFYLHLGANRDDSERHFKFTGDAFRSLAEK